MSDQTTTPTKQKRRRPILKWGLFVLGGLFALLILLLLFGRYAAQSSFGRNFVEARIEAAAPSGQDIEVEDLTGDLLGTFRIGRLTIADEQGIWLVAENLLMDWKPLALRNRALRVEALEADLIHVLRRPQLVPSDKPKKNGGSMPLRAGDIEKLRIGEFRSDEGVLPRALSLEIDGAGRVGLNGGTTQLSVLPLDGKGDRLSADLKWSDDFRLLGNLQLDGPAGGLFASLARLEESQSISATINAEGELLDWRADADVLIDADNVFALKASAEGQTINFDAIVHPGLHPLTASVAETLGDTLDINGKLMREGKTPVLDVTANADGLELTALANQTEDGGYNADINLTADTPSRYAKRDNIKVGRAVINGNLAYSDGTARFDGDMRASNVDVPSFKAGAVSGPVILIYGDQAVSVRTTLTGEGAVLPGTAGQIAGAQPIVKTNARYDLQSGTLELREANIRGEAGRVAAAGSVSLRPALSADLAGSFQLNGAKAGLARPINAAGQFEAQRAGGGVTRFNTQINATNLGDLPAPLKDWASDQAIINAAGTLQSDNSVDINRFSLTSGSLQATGNGQLSSNQVLSASMDLNAGDASVSGFDIDGMSARANASGPLENLDFVVAVDVPTMSRGELSFTNLRLGADGNYADGALVTNASLDAETSNGPLDLTSDIRLDGGNWQVNDLEGHWGDLVADASLRGSGGDVSQIRGDADVKGSLPDGLPAKSIDASAIINGQTLSLDATLETVTFGPTRADALVIRATGQPDNADILIDMDGRSEINGLTYPTSIDLDANVKGATRGALDVTASLSALMGDIGITTEDPIRFTQYDDGYEASAQFAALGGTLAPSLTTRGTTAISLNGEGLRIAPLMLIAGRPALDGALDINLDWSETESGGLSGPLRADIESVARPGSDLPPIDIFLEGQLTPDLLDLVVRALDNQELEGRIEIDVPVKTSPAPPFISRQQGASMPFTAAIDGQIEAITALLVPPQMLVQGVVDVDLKGTLPNLDESFTGQFSVREGVFEQGELGLVMNSIAADASLGNGVVTLNSFNANGRTGGTLSGNGTMSLDGSGESDLEIKANKLVVSERREGFAKVSGTMTVTQKPELLEIIGDLTVDEGEINLDRLPQGGPATLDVSFKQPDDKKVEEKPQASTNLDIQLSAPGRIDVRGRGVNAELALDADISGPLGSPVITGEASIVRGRFDLLGKRFQFSDSTVRLLPELGNSRLSITASHETRDDITAILNVTNTISRPEIQLTSNPELPEDEVLSRVLFGRSPSQLTALETARLAAALAQLSGGGGFDLLGGIEQALGLDTFDVGSDAGGGVEVTSGKYLSEDVYLEVRSGAAGAPGIGIEWTPFKNIEIEAATNAGEEQGQELSIQWKKDFDDPR
ncbi:translocation/assembly module TamB domain-containing protein [Henriciella litoralis]|uniref:translocation/assembly module TamB domain-containing protein n=1 Tax=Henriciella litoralis TaxID=568102 RepID=UPI0009FE8788|nr:translocation/assembly module TamB domain-containing protein [Henriciella litoralis]